MVTSLQGYKNSDMATVHFVPNKSTFLVNRGNKKGIEAVKGIQCTTTAKIAL